MSSTTAEKIAVLQPPDQTAGGEAATTRPDGKKRRPRGLIASLIALGVGVAGIFWISAPASSETTDDAYVQADSTSVAPKVRGLVAEILVRDNQAVHAGDPLIRIDPEEFDAKVQAARADLADADAAVRSSKAALQSQGAEEGLAQSQVGEAATAIRSAGAVAQKADADRSRTDALAERGFASRQTVDSFRAEAISSEQAAARARAALLVSRRSAALTNSKRDSLVADLSKAEARRSAAQAALDLALQDQGHTLIRAPIDGIVGNRQVQVGDYVQPGSHLLTLVPMQRIYVTANFKETQVRNMRVGERATIKVDALASPLSGDVESFAPGSGSTFSLLPFEPGTGNFTKIVQRIPVRIRLDAFRPRPDQLRPGLSASVTVRVR